MAVDLHPMRTEAAKKLLAASPDWVVYGARQEAGGASMLDYHRYFAVCTRLGSCGDHVLSRLRSRMGGGFAHVAPQRMVHDKATALWRLDAKIAEYCLTGQACKEGLL